MHSKLKRVKEILISQHLDAVLISSQPNITYLTEYSNFSLDEREAFLLITQDDRIIFTDGRYTTEVKKMIPGFTLLEISKENSFYKLLNNYLSTHKLKSLGIEENDISVAEFKKLKSITNNIKSAGLQKLRLIKTKDEINKIREACKIGDQAFEYILTVIKSGITEKQVANYLKVFINNKGAEISFNTIIAFSENAAIPHHATNDRVLGVNELILLDFGVKLDNYSSDMTRTIFTGMVTHKQRLAYQTVLKSQELTKSFIESNLTKKSKKSIIKAADADKAARTFIINQNFPTIPHSVGHGIGIQVHEPPSLSPNSEDLLSEGMVFSIEPGIYLPDNFGIRIEDLFVIESNKIHQLTNSAKNLIQI